MKEEEGEGEVVAVTLSSSSSSSRSYLSPVVRQDLAKLEKGGESRRIAMTMLKQFVEHLDPGSVPRFLAQVSESKDLGGSRTYAISLYEEVARVHGKLIIPQIPRMMATVTRSLSASGSSPPLHQACAKVVSALARYAIDPETSTAQADEILQDISKPLIEAIAAGRVLILHLFFSSFWGLLDTLLQLGMCIGFMYLELKRFCCGNYREA